MKHLLDGMSEGEQDLYLETLARRSVPPDARRREGLGFLFCVSSVANGTIELHMGDIVGKVLMHVGYAYDDAASILTASMERVARLIHDDYELERAVDLHTSEVAAVVGESAMREMILLMAEIAEHRMEGNLAVPKAVARKLGLARLARNLTSERENPK